MLHKTLQKIKLLGIGSKGAKALASTFKKVHSYYYVTGFEESHLSCTIINI